MFARRIIAVGVAALGAAAVGLTVATAGTAGANGIDDDSFVAQLESQGISFGSPQAAVRQGHQVCTELEAGKTKVAVSLMMMGHAQLSARQAGYFVGAAAEAYCP